MEQTYSIEYLTILTTLPLKASFDLEHKPPSFNPGRDNNLCNPSWETRSKVSVDSGYPLPNFS